MEQKLVEMENNWYGELQDIFVELNEMGIDVYESNAEYIVAGYVDGDEDVQIKVNLSGTASTIVIESIEEIYRG